MKKIMTKAFVLCLFVIICLSCLAGCDLMESMLGTKYDIEWQTVFEKEPSENVQITVEGYDVLPTKIPSGDEISVTIEGTNGYKVHRVKINNRKATPNEDGKYVFTVSEDTEVEITLREKVAGVIMPDLVFYAGEQLDRKAVEAEIVYATGRTEKTNKYSVVYQSESADAFSLGDTSYSVKLSADRDNLYKVDLKEPVYCKGVIDPHGGSIAEEYINSLKTNTEISNVTLEDDGSISFTFNKPLTADIALPTADQISKGDGDDFVFQGWSSTIAAGTDKSVHPTAVYQTKLVILTGIKLETREIDGESVPCLIISGQFRAATNVYLFLIENNKGVELTGSSVGGEDTQRGDEFELVFDLRKTNESEYLGAWMDITLRCEIDGHTETQDINITDYSDEFVDLTSYVLHDGYRYEFKTYEDLLKLQTTDYFYHGYTFSYELNKTGEVILTIAGNVVSKYAGNIAKLDIEYDIDGGNRTIETKYCVIDENGSYSVSMNLFNLPTGCNAYIHFWIIDSMEEENIIYVGKENNLQNEWCENTNLSNEYNGIGLITGGGLRCPNPDETRTYYVGMGQWGGAVIYGKNDNAFSYSADSAKIYEENGRVKISVGGKFRGQKAEMEAEAALWVCDLQENPYASGRTDWSGNWYAHEQSFTLTVNNDGTFSLVIDVTDVAWSEASLSKQCYTTHLGREGQGSNGQNPDLKLTANIRSTITVGTTTYTLVSVPGSGDGAEFWGCLGLIIEK